MAADLLATVTEALAAELEDHAAEIIKLAEALDESKLWAKPVQPGNSIGHLILHLTGNLNNYIGAQLGGTGYVRDREREFTETRPPGKAALLAGFKEAVALSRRVITGLSAEQLMSPFAEAKFGNTCKAIMHMIAHAALHRGQMSYLVRLVEKK